MAFGFPFPQSERLLPVYRAADRADAKTRPAEIQMVFTVGPVCRRDAQHFAAVARLDVAYRMRAALTGAQAGVIVAALGRLFKYCSRHFEHWLYASTVFPNFARLPVANIDKYQI